MSRCPTLSYRRAQLELWRQAQQVLHSKGKAANVGPWLFLLFQEPPMSKPSEEKTTITSEVPAQVSEKKPLTIDELDAVSGGLDKIPGSRITPGEIAKLEADDPGFV